MRVKTTLFIGFAILAGLTATGCVLHTGVGVAVGPPVEYGYQPLLYDGYVVYYTDEGIPFYWNGGVRVFVPVGYRTVYVDHWRSHRSAYVRWHRHRGHHYRSRHYRGRSHHRAHKPTRSRHKPVLRPDNRRDKPRLRPDNRRDKPRLTPKRKGHKSKPVLKPKKKKKKKKKK